MDKEKTAEKEKLEIPSVSTRSEEIKQTMKKIVQGMLKDYIKGCKKERKNEKI